MSLSRRRFLLSCAALLAGCRRASRTTSPPQTASSAATSTAATGIAKGPPLSTGESGSPAVSPHDVPPDPGLGRDPFRLGVASGDPLVDRVVLWTRLAPDADFDAVGGMPDQPVPLLWEMTDDRGDFQQLVATGIAVAEPGAAHSVHVDVPGLPAERWFRYRFRIGPWTSAVGRTRTAPAANADAPALTLAVGSCQNWQSGYYTAYPYLVADQPDLVVWCGDYIYEGGAGGEGPRRHDGPAAVTLDEYRNRYALYRSDPALQGAHAACPWVVTWDDHEVVDNYAAAVDSAGRGGDDFQSRRAAAYRAWWEHMPVRLPAPRGPDLAVHREVRWGKLATLLILDGRQHRTPQPCGGGLADLCQGRDAEDATMLGADQEAWVAERFAASTAAGVVWTTLVN
ncbi:MAG: alkaline phosphatase, partial [Acidimicrobiia bacterium]|nr:alkaline phosphatase [Acidimicrobiia bacterium]